MSMEAFTLAWDEPTEVVQEEEVICGMEEEVPVPAEDFNNVCEEVVVQEDHGENGAQEVVTADNMIYMPESNMLVMQQGTDGAYMEELVVTEQWTDETCPEIVVGSEEHVVGEGKTLIHYFSLAY